MKGLEQLLPFVLIAAVFWFLLIRPQRRRQMEMASTQRSVEVGDEVMLGAGIFGRVAEADDEFLQLEISPGVVMRVARGAVVRVVVPEEPETPTPEEPGPPADGTARYDEPTDPERDH